MSILLSPLFLFWMFGEKKNTWHSNFFFITVILVLSIRSANSQVFIFPDRAEKCCLQVHTTKISKQNSTTLMKLYTIDIYNVVTHSFILITHSVWVSFSYAFLVLRAWMQLKSFHHLYIHLPFRFDAHNSKRYILRNFCFESPKIGHHNLIFNFNQISMVPQMISMRALVERAGTRTRLCLIKRIERRTIKVHCARKRKWLDV